MTDVWLYLAIGLLAGAVSGMGLGGGAVMIPALTLLAGMEQQAAQSLNLVVFIPTAAVALVVHVRNGSVERGFLLRTILVGLAFAAAGSFLALRLDALWLRRIFGVFLFAVGVSELFRKEEQES
ncbi:MAG: sulfite exporter TauE/SafE family protein [Defluviitaleaceae bacterium]|nr:sulfite exporter TauE/SafE family protein [Defluviitaleaceae bacterium]